MPASINTPVRRTRDAHPEERVDYRKIFSLDSRVLIVTGGAGHLGKEMSKGLASFGAHVIVVGRNQGRLRALRSFRPKGPIGTIECAACDVSDEQAFAAMVKQTWKKYGRIDGLLNNADAGGREPWEELEKREWLGGLEGTLHHYFTCTKIVLPYLLKAGKGAIVNTASIWSFLAPNPKMYLDLNNGPSAHTCAAKGAILQLTRYLATLWGPRGIRVNAISPGWFPKKRGPERPDYLREITSRVPIERIGTPSELVGVAVFLLSDASSYMTGQNLIVDGGYSVW